MKEAGWKEGMGLGVYIFIMQVYTRGVGGRIMKEAGWKEGMGLGANNSGIPTAIGNFKSDNIQHRQIVFICNTRDLFLSYLDLRGGGEYGIHSYNSFYILILVML